MHPFITGGGGGIPAGYPSGPFALGDLLVGDGTDLIVLPVGATSTVLREDGGGSVEWSLLDSANLDAAANILFSQLEDPAWTAYTPAWSSDGTQPTLGASIINGFYQQIGKIVFWRLLFQLGAGFNAGTGNYVFTLPPVTPVTTQSPAVGVAIIKDDNTNANTIADCLLLSSTTVRVDIQGTGRFSATTPITTLAVPDNMRIWGQYEAA